MYKPLPLNTLSSLRKSVSPKLPFSNPQINYFSHLQPPVAEPDTTEATQQRQTQLSGKMIFTLPKLPLKREGKNKVIFRHLVIVKVTTHLPLSDRSLENTLQRNKWKREDMMCRKLRVQCREFTKRPQGSRCAASLKSNSSCQNVMLMGWKWAVSRKNDKQNYRLFDSFECLAKIITRHYPDLLEHLVRGYWQTHRKLSKAEASTSSRASWMQHTAGIIVHS